MTEPERDECKLRRVEGMRSRAKDLYAWHDDSYLDRIKPARRKLKRARRLFRQADRIMEVRLLKFQALRRADRWPRP